MSIAVLALRKWIDMSANPTKSATTLKRPLEVMPEFVADALAGSGLEAAYRARPPYQRNDYLRWIVRAARDETKKKRLDQMLSELKIGGVYMKMKWNGPARND